MTQPHPVGALQHTKQTKDLPALQPNPSAFSRITSNVLSLLQDLILFEQDKQN